MSPTSEVLETGAKLEPALLPAERPRKFWRWEYLAVFLAILLIAGIRFRLRDFPLERDEGEYAYAGQLLLDGHLPYQVMYSMKLPGTYISYAAIMSVFGQTPSGIHIGVMLVNAASMFLLFLITQELFDSVAAVVAGATFGLFAARPMLLGLAGHATHFVALAGLASIFLVLKAYKTGQDRLLFWSGLCSGLAFLMKQPGLFFAAFGLFYIGWKEWNQLAPRRRIAKPLGIFSFAAVLPYLATCILLWRAGAFQRFWFWTVSYARAYGGELSAWRSLLHFANAMEFQKENVLVIWLLAIFGLAAFLWDHEMKPQAPIILGLLGFSFLAVTAGFIYRPHYFIVFYPAVAILAGLGVSSASRLMGKLLRRPALTLVPIAIFALAFANALYAERTIYFHDSPDAAARKIYGDVPFPQGVVIGHFIKQNSRPAERVAVLGSEPEILFYAHRLSATGYIYTYPLMEDQLYAPQMKAEFMHEIETGKPDFLVSVMIMGSWFGSGQFDPTFMTWADAYIKKDYSLVGIADGGNHDEYRWGPNADSYRPRRPTVILVFRRKS